MRDALEPQLRLVRMSLALAFIAGLLLSRRLWLTSPRFYPTAPLLEVLAPLAYPLDYALFAMLLGALALSAFAPRAEVFVVAACLITVFLMACDQTRWQPWAYQYLLMLAALVVPAPRTPPDATKTLDVKLDACRLIIAAIYFWSGWQKVNYNFSADVLPNLMQSYVGALPDAWRRLPTYAGALVPVVEVFTGVGLLFKRTRGAAVVTALAAHCFIMLLFVPVGRNTVIWPWNMAMACFVIILFWGERDFSLKRAFALRRSTAHALIAALVVVMPLFNFVGLWDSYLSAALYAGNTRVAELRMDAETARRLPPQVQRVVTKKDDGSLSLNLGRWSYAELNVPAYPETRVLRVVARRVCAEATDASQVVLEIKERPRLIDGSRRTTTQTCAELDAP
ncbi:MAG TPA: MauE/DoxX family redox-associated membrane protein [Pyrinomonadaceae bacterium]|nr:MauE/DoxX family redox-associated membrane protein [Pyrinomonadaceae bacterium]